MPKKHREIENDARKRNAIEPDKGKPENLRLR